MKLKIKLPNGDNFSGWTEHQTTSHFLVISDSNRLGEWIAKRFCYGQATKKKSKGAQNRAYGTIGQPVQAVRDNGKAGIRLHNPPRGQTSPARHKLSHVLLLAATLGILESTNPLRKV